MVDYNYLITQVKEIFNSNEDFEDLDLSFLHYSFPYIESVDLELLNDCSDQIPANGVKVTGYYCNVDDNYISVYLSQFDQFAKAGFPIQRENYEAIKESLFNLVRMVNDNSYRDINESRPLYDLCDYIVNHKGMELILNIVTNYPVPLQYEKDGRYTIGVRDVSLRTYDINDILDKVNANISDVPTLNLLEKFGRGVPAVLISSNRDIDVYLTYFVGDWLAQLYKEDSTGLLSANVRSYLKRTNKVNREIIETVKEAPQEFVAYNNGLSAIATDINYSGSNGFVTINELTGFLIVNGGQTTATLYECKNDKQDLSKVIVPAKLSIIKNTDSSEYLISNISVFSNSQTAIKRSDPPSNSKFYKTYEGLSKSLLAKKNMTEYHCFFERTNGQYNTQKRMHTKKTDPFIALNPEKSKFTKLQLAQAINSWEQMPDLVCKGQEKNFEQFHSVVKDLSTKVIDENYFKGSYALVLLYRKLDQIIKKQKLPYKSNLIAYTLAFLSLKCNKRLDLIKIWDEQEVSKEISDILTEMVIDVYTKLIDSPDKYPDIRMWSRKRECWDNVKTISKSYYLPKYDTIWEFLPENHAKDFFDNNLKNPLLWKELEKWIQESDASLNESQIKMIHGMPAVIYKDEKSIKKMTKKQENFARSIFLVAVEQGFDFEDLAI